MKILGAFLGAVALVVPSAGLAQVTQSYSYDANGRLTLRPNSATNMTVITDARVYNFELSSAYAQDTDTPFTVDVRFRLHRFGAHLVEHTQQVEKTLRALGQNESDAQAYVRQISIIRGRHERRSPEGVRRRLDEQITAVAEAAKA